MTFRVVRRVALAVGAAGAPHPTSAAAFTTVTIDDPKQSVVCPDCLQRASRYRDRPETCTLVFSDASGPSIPFTIDLP